ncbi:hypothetical protein B2M26_14300 [Ferroacidibacillus organovorans]|uniref:Septum formation initiator n=2 Tax=Ferroacidibacillus organovorans TaxID=1765683 RepID=A0A1V4EQ76_9BACL|nr:hypothetical protein B2M26_14300 [Ferroacidibacillus organovorans]
MARCHFGQRAKTLWNSSGSVWAKKNAAKHRYREGKVGCCAEKNYKMDSSFERRRQSGCAGRSRGVKEDRMKQPSNVVQIASGSRLRSRFKLRYLVVATFLVWGGYVYFFVQRPLLLQQAFAKQQVISQLQNARILADSLSRQVKNLSTDSYIAQLAEQKYNLIQPGEILFTTGNANNSPK